MKRWLRFPLLAAALLLLWLLLNETFTMGHVVLGVAIAVVSVLAYARLQAPAAKRRRIRSLARLIPLVLIDIVRSNIAVAQIVLSLNKRQSTSGFLEIPLELRDPAGLAALACIITATPGTAWVRYDSTRGVLTLHILDLVDETVWTDTIKGRYERHLLEIFG